MLDFISDSEHFLKVLDLALKAKQTLWTGTADIKGLYVMQGKTEKPFLGVLSEPIDKGVAVRLIHAKNPGPDFREDFDRYPRLATMPERVMCPHIRFKTIAIDRQFCYVDNANLTGTGMGMKSAARRNFEDGILTDIHLLWRMQVRSSTRHGVVASARNANAKVCVQTR